MTDKATIRVAVIMGSKSDWEVMKNVTDTLAEFNIESEAKVLSAHRTPNELRAYLEESQADVFIAGAGAAAHLAGAIASHTAKPVLGVPLAATDLNGLDALLSTVQMPGGIPVATFAVGKAGAINAAIFAVSILAQSEPKLHDSIVQYRKRRAEQVLAQKL